MTLPIGERALSFVLDTNVIWDSKRLTQLGNKVQELNRRLPKASGLSLLIPALCVGEKLLHLSRVKGTAYAPKQFFFMLEDIPSIKIVAFTATEAEQLVKILQPHYADERGWYDFKRDQYLRRLGIDVEAWADKNDAGSTPAGKHCSLTVDWFIRAQAEAPDHWLVTNDRGNEFKALERRIRFDELDKLITEALSRTNPAT